MVDYAHKILEVEAVTDNQRGRRKVSIIQSITVSGSELVTFQQNIEVVRVANFTSRRIILINGWVIGGKVLETP